MRSRSRNRGRNRGKKKQKQEAWAEIFVGVHTSGEKVENGSNELVDIDDKTADYMIMWLVLHISSLSNNKHRYKKPINL